MSEWLFFLFIIKHLICDFFLQFPRHYKNKGIYGHWGGIEHALIHALGTLLIMNPLSAIIDGIIHYHIDWVKMKLNAVKGWKPDTSEWFWYSLGIDQFLHYTTYLGLIIYFGGH